MTYPEVGWAWNLEELQGLEWIYKTRPIAPTLAFSGGDGTPLPTALMSDVGYSRPGEMTQMNT